MTEQVTEGSETEAQKQELTFPDPVAEATFNMINDLIAKRNTLVGKVNAVKGDPQTLMEQLRETSDNPDAVEARARRDQAQEALDQAVLDLDEAVRPEVKAVMGDSEGEAAKIENEIKELDDKIKPANTYFKKMYGEALAKALKPLERLKGFSTRGSGTTGRRIRGYNAVAVIDGEETQYENLASVAKDLNLETSALQEAFFKAAGVEVLKEAPNRVEFNVDFTETYEDGSTEAKTAHVICEREVKSEAASDVADDPETNDSEVDTTDEA